MHTENKKPWYKRPRTWIVIVVLIVLFFVIRNFTTGTSTPRETATITRGTVKEELVLSGELKATQNANLQFNLSGKLAWIGVKVGDIATKGQALMQLDTTAINAVYQQSRSTLHASEANVNYVHDTLKNKDSTETFAETNTRVSAEVTHDNAYNAMLAAQKSLKDAIITAPFSGIISQLTNETPGVNITAATPQINLVNPATLYFSVNADQTDIARLQVGQKAQIVLDAFSGEMLTATISQISFTPSTSDTGTVYPLRLTLSVDNSSYKYKVGMTGDTTFVLSQKDNVLSLPTKFVKSDKDGKYVFIDDKNTKKYVQLGIEGDETTEIKTDLPEGTTVFN